MSFHYKNLEIVVCEKTKPDSPKFICDVCECFKPVYKCRECVQLMCCSCNNKHKRVSQFQHYHVCMMADHNLCDEHKQNVTHLCVKCAKRLCMKCMLIGHLGHEKEELKSMKTKIKENLSELLHAKKSLQANVSITMQVKANL